MNIKDVLQERGEIIDKMKLMIGAAESEKRDFTDEEAQTYDRMDEAQKALKSRADRMHAQAQLDAEMTESFGDRKSAPRPLLSPFEAGKPDRPCASAAYRSGFDEYCRRGKAALDGRVLNALSVGTDSEGGYIVPEEFDTMLVMAMQQINPFRQYATVITTAGDRHIPIEDTLGTAAWTAEEAAYTESDAAFGRVTIGAHKLATILKASEELLQDSFFNLESYLAGNFGKRFGLAEEAAFVNGDGIGKPKGFAPNAGVTTPAAGEAAITSDELINLYHALKRPYRANAVWVMADATVGIVRKLKDGDQQYLWQPGLQAGEPDRILGRTLITSEGMPAATTGNRSVVFGDLSYYTICDRSGTVVQRLNELYAANGQVGFRAFRRTDGAVTLPEAIAALVQATP